MKKITSLLTRGGQEGFYSICILFSCNVCIPSFFTSLFCSLSTCLCLCLARVYFCDCQSSQLIIVNNNTGSYFEVNFVIPEVRAGRK